MILFRYNIGRLIHIPDATTCCPKLFLQPQAKYDAWQQTCETFLCQDFSETFIRPVSPIKIHIDCHRDTFYLYLSLSHLNFSSVFNAIFQQRQELVWKFTLLDFLFLFVCSCLQAKTRRGKSGPTLPRAPRCLLPPIHTLPPALPGAGSGRGPSESFKPFLSSSSAPMTLSFARFEAPHTWQHSCISPQQLIPDLKEYPRPLKKISKKYI